LFFFLFFIFLYFAGVAPLFDPAAQGWAGITVLSGIRRSQVG